MVTLYDGSTWVSDTPLLAANANGRLHLEILNQPEFTTVIFRAGVVEGGVFHAGHLVNADGGHVAATGSLGSDYLIEALQFLDLPDVLLTGHAADFGG